VKRENIPDPGREQLEELREMFTNCYEAERWRT